MELKGKADAFSVVAIIACRAEGALVQHFKHSNARKKYIVTFNVPQKYLASLFLYRFV